MQGTSPTLSAVVNEAKNALLDASEVDASESEIVDLFEELVRAIVREEMSDYEDMIRWEEEDDREDPVGGAV